MAEILSGTALSVLSTIMARSNMGHGHPQASHVARLKSISGLGLTSAVADLCGEFSEMVEDMDQPGRMVDTLTFFEEEAVGWYDTLSKMTWEAFAAQFPSHAEFYLTCDNEPGS